MGCSINKAVVLELGAALALVRSKFRFEINSCRYHVRDWFGKAAAEDFMADVRRHGIRRVLRKSVFFHHLARPQIAIRQSFRAIQSDGVPMYDDAEVELRSPEKRVISFEVSSKQRAHTASALLQCRDIRILRESRELIDFIECFRCTLIHTVANLGRREEPAYLQRRVT